MKSTYLDFNATTPVRSEVVELMKNLMNKDFGNAGSRTHQSGLDAKKYVARAREQIAQVANCQVKEVIFTSGATESNNIALLGIADFGNRNNRKHIISSVTEHKAVLEPLEILAKNGFEVELIKPHQNGVISKEHIKSVLREDTLLVSLMHANNETGVLNEVNEVAQLLSNTSTFFHVDAAQTFAKTGLELSKEIDLISASAHKTYGPKGIGALVYRQTKDSCLKPIMVGGGQEQGLRPGTLPVSQIAGFGLAAELAALEAEDWNSACQKFKSHLMNELELLGASIAGDRQSALPNTLNVAIKDIDAEALIIMLKEICEIATGSACTSEQYEPSHVLTGMGLSNDQAQKHVRFSWSSDVDQKVVGTISERIKLLS